MLDIPQLSDLLTGRVCVLGVGNRDRGDDGCGSIIAEHLADTMGSWAIDAGSVPENYLEKAARLEPDTVLVIDAIDFGGTPGEARLLDADAIATGGLSTHALSLSMATEYFMTRTNARVAFLGIQPASLNHGGALSTEVSQTVSTLQEVLASLKR